MSLSSIYSSGMRTADVINLASVAEEKHRAIYKRTWVNKPISLPLMFDPMELGLIFLDSVFLGCALNQLPISLHSLMEK